MSLRVTAVRISFQQASPNTPTLLFKRRLGSPVGRDEASVRWALFNLKCKDVVQEPGMHDVSNNRKGVVVLCFLSVIVPSRVTGIKQKQAAYQTRLFEGENTHASSSLLCRGCVLCSCDVLELNCCSLPLLFFLIVIKKILLLQQRGHLRRWLRC